MKKGSYIKFLCLFIIIIGVYFIWITHIDFFINNYENKVISYQNNYKLSQNSYNIIEVMLNEGKMRMGTLEDLENILQMDYPLQILNYFFNNKNIEETKIYLEKLAEENMFGVISTSYYEEEIIYITLSNGIIALTKDGKNIYYNNYLNGVTCSNEEISKNKNIEVITENINKYMHDYHITNYYNFEITSIRKAPNIEYNGIYGEVYYIEDIENSIKMTYELKCNAIYNMQIGFKELELY